MCDIIYKFVFLCVFLNPFSSISQKFYSNNFEDGQSGSWAANENWVIDSLNPISGGYSVRHNIYGKGGESFLRHTIADTYLNEGELEWSFTIKSGSLPLDGLTSFVFFLAADTVGYNSLNGYGLGVNIRGNDNILELYKYVDGEAEQEIIRTDLRWGPDTEVSIIVERSNRGSWKLRYRFSDNQDWSPFFTGEASDSYLSFSFQGLLYRYSATAGGQLWFDDFSFKACYAPPYISDVCTTSQDEILVIFSKKIDSKELVNPENYSLTINGEQEVKIKSVSKANDKIPGVYLSLDEGSYLDLILTVNNICDEAGNFPENPELNFLFSPPCTEHCIVFNEIMADPYPAEGLPNCEYIELINRTDYAVLMENWELEMGDKKIGMPDTTLAPGAMLLICGKGRGDSLISYGKIMELNGFSINNSGASFQLVNDGYIVDEFVYTPSMHESGSREGGWSLERVDAERFCGQDYNWRTSLSVTGGTPGEQNSVKDDNIDVIPPELVYLRASSDDELKVFFSEDIAGECFLPGNIRFSEELPGFDSIKYKRTIHELDIFFPENSIKNGEQYKLWFEKLEDECGNINTDVSGDFVYDVPVNGEILISEVLFNPLPGAAEFVEIFNSSNRCVDLSRMFLAVRTSNFDIKTLCKIAESELLICPGEYRVITGDSMAVISGYLNPCSECIIEMDIFPRLNNENGRVVLLNSDMQVIDELEYSEDMHHELISNTRGVSLERKSFIRLTNEQDNWHSASSGSGYSTPGYENSSLESGVESNSTVSVCPQIFSPNNDGFNDKLVLKISTGETGWLASAGIYTPDGLEVCSLAANRLISPEESIEWNGCSENNQKQDLGIYILLVELFHPDGRKQAYRYPCVITDKSF